MSYELIDRRVMDDGWRDSTYKRDDGSTFRVAIPQRVEVDRYSGQPGQRSYNERAEHEMALRLAAIDKEDTDGT